MQKIKDIFYDTNDIIVALLIIAAALFLIWTRVTAIMEYPSSGAADEGALLASANGEEWSGAAGDAAAADATDSATGIDAGIDADIDAGTAADGGETTGDGDAQESAPAAENDPVTEYSVYIAYGETGAQIAQKLLDAGLIKSNEEFYDALIEADAATRLQAGTFIIPSTASPAEIVSILTSP
jgi:hypothetical protein